MATFVFVVIISVPIILGLIVGIVLARGDVYDPLGNFFVGFFVTILFSGILTFGATYIVASIQADPYITHIPIRAVGASTESEGHFFLGSGTVRDKAVFYYYRDDADGLSLKYRYADYTKILEDENDNPYMACHIKKYPDWWGQDHPKISRYDDCVFHVPVDSVVQQYKLTTP